ncbi:MAG: hypothetical protein A2283_17635 [Lentisphaerae bacterium RIFOXYA12_FULL_48_11]|nr:MAG: hypothetical protein A2283_17635 [Lentisphaerae bacterium RIFOXYA12_FULL_48_11]
MRLRFIVAAVLFQLFVLVWMAGERELVYKTGRTVYLRTMPVDPHDHFRGDYVHLNYEISNIGRNYWRGGLKDRKKDDYTSRRKSSDIRIYTALKAGENNIGEFQYVTDQKPEKDFFIRGRLQNTWGSSLQARYGIEAYFVQQDKGRELEKGMNRDGINVPMEMEVAISGNGIAVLKGYRWSPIGIGISLNTQTNQQRAIILKSADIKLMNASKTDIAVVDLPDGSSFTLEPDFRWGWSQEEWRWVGAKPHPSVTDTHVRVLKPGDIHKVHFDFSNPAWFVIKDNEQPKSLSDPGNQSWSARFRLVYRPPSREECAGLANASIIWHGSMASRAFSGGRID